MVNGTPILDIKPYIAYADSEPDAHSSFAQEKPPAPLTVSFTKAAQQAVENLPHFAKFGIDDPLNFIREVIAQDPRPAYQQGKNSERIYGMNLAGLNIRWQMEKDAICKAIVIEIKDRNF